MVKPQLKRILVVDDEENTRIALTRLLNHDGYEVKTAANGLEALNSLRSSPVELIITDLNMPEMNGLAFLRELNREYPASNVIMITAFGEVESYLEALNLGAFEYLNKPLRLEELRKVMAKMFPLSSNERRMTDEAL
jgi:DNA-binding NtrC family response regulator